MDQPTFGESEAKEEAKTPVIKFLTPCYMGQINSRFFHSFLNQATYLMNIGVNFTIETLPNCSLISLGRNIMIRRAMTDPKWTHLMFLDADIEWDPRCIHSMLADDKPIIGGFYPKKGLPIDMASSPMLNNEDVDSPVYETDYVATGFMMIKREVIEGMMEFYPERKFYYQGADEYYDLFAPYIDTESPNRLYLTEDFAFCKLARAAGFKSYMSKRFTLQHHGAFCFSKPEEEYMLKEYERMGYIEIKQLTPDWDKLRRDEEEASAT